ncbi:MAG: sugar kinase, partial [Thiolinea sp.]
NTAVYLARCAKDKVAVHYVTALGDDALSTSMLTQWQAEGLHTDTVELIAGTVPGLYMIQTDAKGERSFLYWRDQAPVKQLLQTANTERLTQQLLGLDWLYYTGITLAVLEPEGRRRLFDLLDQFRQRGGKVAFDINYRPRLWQENEAQEWICEAYRRCDLALPSVDDESDLWGKADATEILQRLEGFGCREIVLKRGVETCLVSYAGELTEYAVTPVNEVVDTTAAGDSFNGAYLASRMLGRGVDEAIAVGQRLAAEVISQPGAIVNTTVTL